MPWRPPQSDKTSVEPRLEKLERENTRLRQKVERVERERDRWKRRSERLEQELDAARRAGCRQAAPFAKQRRQGLGRRPGRRAGAHYGRRACRPRPAIVDETHRAALPARCRDCGGAVAPTRMATQYQEDLPVVRPLVRRFDIEIGHCTRRRHRVQGRHRLQTSDALGAASAGLGPRAVALVVEMHTQLGVPLAKVAQVLRTQFQLSVTPGGLAHLLHRTARQAAPTYDALRGQVRASAVVTPDETSWRVGAVSHWLWTFATPQAIVYQVRPTRGFAEAARVLGADFSGVLVRDGWAPYRCFTAARHQTCLAHLLRRAARLAADHPHSTWVADAKAILHAALTLRDRRDAGQVGSHGVASVAGRLRARLDRLLNTSSTLADVNRFAKHLDTEWDALFTFLDDPAVDATNWRAEQVIRPAVVTRKVCGGNRTRRGADTQQVLASLVATARQRHLELAPLIDALLRSPQPAVPETLKTLPP